MYTKHQIRNFKHFLFKKENTRPFFRLVKKGQRRCFYSLYDAAEYLGCEVPVLWEAFLQTGRYQGYQLQYIKGTEVEAIHAKLYQYHQYASRRPGVKRPVSVLDVFSGVVSEYDSIKLAASALEIPEGNVRASISTQEKQRLLYERYMVVDTPTGLDFVTPEIKTRLIESIRSPVVVFDTQMNTLRTFSSLAAYLRIIHIHDKLYNLQRRLRVRGIIGIDNRYYILRQSPLIKPLNEDELRRHFHYLIKEVLGE